MAKAEILVGKDPSEVASQLRRVLEEQFAKRKSSFFVIGLSGGSLPKAFAQVAAAANVAVEWNKVRFIFCDERLVPVDHAESTWKAYRDTVVGKVAGIEEDNFVLPDTSIQSAEDAAKDYSAKLAALGDFDLLLLGMGPDGHTCSLFPGHPLLEEVEKTVAAIEDSPKPPPRRVTLTLPVLNAAAAAVFVCTGDAKKQIVREILQEGSDAYPAGRVRPTSGRLVWILDAAAASSLDKEMLAHT